MLDFDEETQYKINCFDWEDEFKNVFKGGGFDVVIGNPPWVQSKFIDKELKKYYSEKYSSIGNQYDLFCLFTEKSYSLIKENGINSFIIPNRFFTNVDYQKFREYIINNFGIKELFSVGEHIFYKVEMPSCIYIFTKSHNDNIKYKYCIGHYLDDNIVENLISLEEIKEDKNLSFKITTDKSINKILNKIRDNKDEFSILANNARGVEIGKSSDLILFEADNNTEKFLVGEDISRYSIKYKNRYIKTDAKGIQYKSPDLYNGKKILIRKTGHGINAVLDTDNYWVIQVIYIFKLKENINEDYLYILGLLNSKLMYFYYYETFGEKDKQAFPHVRQSQVLELPIKRINFNDKTEKEMHDKMVALVDSIIALNKKLSVEKNPNAVNMVTRQINAVDKQIDALVYKLYNLSDEEVRIIEGE